MSKDITKIVSTDFMETTLEALHRELEENKYVLPTASSTLGGVKTTSTVTSNSGYTACPIISGVPYYKDTNTDTNNFVLQSASTTSNYRPLLLGYTNVTDTTKLDASVTNQIYANRFIYAQPSTGAIFANSFNGNLNGNATSATKATNATNADKAATATTLTGLTSSVTELNYCKGVTSAIQTQLNNRIINNVFTSSGISGTNGYTAFARLKITGSYVNRPIEFELICRGKSTPCYVQVMFANSSSTDPSLSYLQYWGTDYGVFAIKEDVSTWLLYYHKSESYDNVTIARVQASSQSITITYPEVFITEKPKENIINATLGGYIGNASVATTANNALKLNGFTLSTSGAKNTWSTIPSIGADGVMEVGKFLDFHATKESTSDFDVRVTATTAGLTLSGTTTGTFIGNITGNLTGNASTATKLETARTIQTNLASTIVPSFNGSENIVIGVTGILPLANGGTGQTSAVNSANVFLNALSVGGSTPQDNDYFISQYAGGGTTNTTYHRRPVSALWTYIKGKTDNLYSLKTHTHSYLPLSGGTMTGSLILNTNTGSTPLKITRMGSTSEQTLIYQNDNGLVLDLTNDETTSSIVINMKSTDTESGDGVGANSNTVKISSSSSGSNITATTFSGVFNGNSSTATKLFTARTISLTGSVTGSGTFDGSNNLSIATTTNHTHSYIPLSGSTAITGVLKTTKEFQTTSANGLRLVQGDYGAILRNDGSSTYLLFTNKADQYGGWNTLRPFSVNNSTGVVTFGNGISGTLNGNASTATKLATARTISLTGSVTGSGSFDGSGNLSISTTTNHNHNLLTLKGTNTISSKANDTTSSWGAHQNSVHWYDTTGQLNDQPSQWGYLLNIGQGGSEVHQFWTTQPNGDVLHRGGNGANWSGTWKTFLDSSNYKNYCTPANIGAATSGHTHSYLPLSGGTITGGLTLSSSHAIRARHLDGSTDGFSGELYLNYNNPNAPIYLGNAGQYISSNGSYYTGTSNKTNSMSSSGFGSGNLTYLQTSGDFSGNTNWCHYIIANHGDGASYYNYIIGLPFWSAPIYQRQTGNTSSKTSWYKFYTSENITCGTSALTAGSSSLATGSIYLQYE